MEESNPRVLFVSLQCPSLSEDFLQYEAIELDDKDTVTFYDFLDAYVRNNPAIPQRKRDALLQQRQVKITCSPSMDSNQSPSKLVILRTLSIMVSQIPISHPFIRFKFSALSIHGDLPRPEENAFAVLMSNQSQRGYPDQLAGKKGGDFPTRLHNCLVEDLKAGQLSVPIDVKEKCTVLIRKVRALLQSVWSKEQLKKKWPERFQTIAYTMKREGHNRDRDRTNRNILTDRLEELTAARDDCAFLQMSLWKGYNKDLSSLTDLVHKEVILMKKKTEQNQKSQAKTEFNPANQIHDLEYIQAVNSPPGPYKFLDEKISSLAEFDPVVVTHDEMDEWAPPACPEETSNQRRKRRKKWIDNLKLSVPVRKCRYSVNGPYPDMVFIWRLGPGMSEQSVRDMLAHKRAMEDVPTFRRRGEWKEVLRQFNWAVGSGLCAKFALKEITNGLLKADNKLSTQDQEMHARIVAFSLSDGNTDLYPDLRASLSGRGRDRYKDFFEFASEYCDSLSGATPYRHGQQRILDTSQSDLVSSRDPGIVSIPALHTKLVTAMKASNVEKYRNAAIPSMDLVRVALTPQYEARAVASRFTARIPFTRAITRATMRKSNPDSHYNNKINKNCNHYICELNNDIYKMFSEMVRPELGNRLVFSKGATKISVDDKGSVSVGEPNHPIRSNVRARGATLRLVPNDKEGPVAPDALDHDFHRANITTSAVLFGLTPSDPNNGSFRNGKVVFSVKDKATQMSNPMRHAVELISAFNTLVADDDATLQKAGSLQCFPEGTSKPFGLVLRSDGGSDRNVKNLSVQLGMIALFLKLDLDYLVVILTAANVSYVNEVEGVMPLANLALQHACFARDEMTKEFETVFKNANSGKAIRDSIASAQTTQEKIQRRDAWRDSLKTVASEIESRLRSTSYNDSSPAIVPPATETSIDELWELLSDTFDPNLGPNMTQKAKVENECPEIMDFIRCHVEKTRYKLEISKCGSDKCRVCKPVRMPRETFQKYKSRPSLIPLPVPVDRIKALSAKPGDSLKYKEYSDTIMIAGDERFLPSFKAPAAASEEAKAIDRKRGEKTPRLFLNNNMRRSVRCQGCNKPRLVYARPPGDAKSLTDALAALADILENPQYDYQCGDELLGLEGDSFAEGNDLLKDKFFTKRALTCGMHVEKSYYWWKTGFPPVCCHCSIDSNFADNDDLNVDVNSCLPICKACVNNGKKLITRGRQKKTNDGNKRKRGQAYKNRETSENRKKPPPGSTNKTTPLAEKNIDNRKPPPPGSTNSNSESVGVRPSTETQVLARNTSLSTSRTSNDSIQEDVARCGNCTGTAPDKTGHNCSSCGVVLHGCCTIGIGEEGHGGATTCYPCLGRHYAGPVLNTRDALETSARRG